MFCVNCGNRIDDGEAFCTRCGTRVPQIVNGNIQTEPVKHEEPVKQEEPVVSRKIVEYNPGIPVVCPGCGNYFPDDQKVCFICNSSLAGAIKAQMITESEAPKIDTTILNVVETEAKEKAEEKAEEVIAEQPKETAVPQMPELVIEDNKTEEPEVVKMAVPSVCAKCGADLVPGNKFCEECGAPIA